MTIARDKILPSGPVWVHGISRCVRRAHLCGGREGRWDHRRGWIEDRLALLSRCFAVEVAAYAVMSNHLHVVVRMRPDVVARWSDEEVIRRWRSVYARRYDALGMPQVPDEAQVAVEAADAVLVARCRIRLAELGWLMKALKEGIAKQANREDGCTGAFWEGRYTSVPLLDQAALVACMAYVDLNPVRAKVADRPERSTHTGVRQRIVARQRHRRAVRSQATEVPVAARALSPATQAEAGLWVAPMAACVANAPGDGARSGLTPDEYLSLVDATGRVLRAGKRGAIPAELAPILARLDLDVERWVAAMAGWRSFIGRAVGGFAVRLARAQVLGLRWIRNRCPLFHGEERAA